MFIFIRILIGLIFCVSGFEKLISPYQNFQYVIQGYELIPANLEVIVAQVLPWIELFVGIFLILGLWIKEMSAAASLMFCMFIFVVAQAMIRKLPIENCGCFGEGIKFPLYVIVIMDLVLLSLSQVVFFKSTKASKFSLDSAFSKSK